MLKNCLLLLITTPAFAFDKPDSLSYANQLEKSTQPWILFWKELNPKFDITKFYISSWTELAPEVESDVNPSKWKNTAYDMFYSYSPDSNYVVDIYTYRMYISLHNGKVSIGPGEPDSQVELVSFITKKWQRLAFTGSESGFDEVIWADSSTFIVMGYSSVKDELYQPDYTVFDLKKRRKIRYSGNVISGEAAKGYVSSKFSDYIEK